MNLQPGDMLLQYQLREVIGAGGMGVVWKAFDSRLGREIALKLLPATAATDPDRVHRFRREATALATLNHPNIVTIHAIEEWQGVHFLVMELVNGESLAATLSSDGMPEARFCDLAAQLFSGLTTAHVNGIVHRDLKPSNLIISRDGKLKILDFGLAKLTASREPSSSTTASTEELTLRGTLLGTLAYMSPEQLRGAAVDQRSDIFSCGVLLYECATTRRPFEGRTVAALASSILTDQPKSVLSIRKGFPASLNAMILRCLEKEPRNRFQCVEEMADVLKNRAHQSPVDVPSATSIAVLSFADMSAAKDQDFLCEGIAEEIINVVSRVRSIRVVSRRSAFLLKAKDCDPEQIGRRLKVDFIVDGSVRKTDQRLRIGVSLVRCTDGTQCWSEQYDRMVDDVFKIQQDIASRIVRTLKGGLTPHDGSVLATQPSTDFRVYEMYLRARKGLYRLRRATRRFAYEMLCRAIDLDPSYAPAYAALGDYWVDTARFGPPERSKDECLRAAATAVERALELDPSSAHSEASRGQILMMQGDYDGAERSFVRAMALDPDLFEVWYYHARYCAARERFAEAAASFERAWELNPQDYVAPLLLPQIYRSLGRIEAVEEVARKGLFLVEETLAINPTDARALGMGAAALSALGEGDRAIEWALSAAAIEPDEPVTQYASACTLAFWGRKDRALDLLEAAVNLGDRSWKWWEVDSDLENVRDHPRFQELLERMRRG